MYDIDTVLPADRFDMPLIAHYKQWWEIIRNKKIPKLLKTERFKMIKIFKT